MNDKLPEVSAGFKGLDRLQQRGEEELLSEELEAALGNFRKCVLAWSESAYTRPRRALAAAPRARVWRLAMGWALGCVLVAGVGVSGGVHWTHHRHELARVAAVKLATQQAEAAEQQRLAVAQQAQDEEELLAKVDSDVSREVPSAMEPLAQLMAEDESK